MKLAEIPPMEIRIMRMSMMKPKGLCTFLRLFRLRNSMPSGRIRARDQMERPNYRKPEKPWSIGLYFQLCWNQRFVAS